MAGGVAASAELAADLAGRDLERVIKRIEERGFAGAGIPCQGAHLAPECLPDGIERSRIAVIHRQDRDADLAVECADLLRGRQIELGQQQ